MAYLTVERLWRRTPVPLLRRSLTRSRALAQLAVIARHSVTKPRGAHGDLVVTVVAHQGGTRLADRVYIGAEQGRALLTTYFDATPSMLEHLLSDTFAQRRAAALTRVVPDEPPTR